MSRYKIGSLISLFHKQFGQISFSAYAFGFSSKALHSPQSGISDLLRNSRKSSFSFLRQSSPRFQSSYRLYLASREKELRLYVRRL